MKVKALIHLTQHVGTLEVTRDRHEVFEVDEDTAILAIASQVVESVEPELTVAKNRKTKVIAPLETK